MPISRLPPIFPTKLGIRKLCCPVPFESRRVFTQPGELLGGRSIGHHYCKQELPLGTCAGLRGSSDLLLDPREVRGLVNDHDQHSQNPDNGTHDGGSGRAARLRHR